MSGEGTEQLSMGQGTQQLPKECYGTCVNPAQCAFLLNEFELFRLLQSEVDLLTEWWSSSLPIGFSRLDPYMMPVTLSNEVHIQPKHFLPCSLCSLMGMRSRIFASL